MDITSKMARQITLWSYREHGSDTEERKAIEYGIALILENIFKLIVLCGIGFLLNRALETVLILLSFCTLRGQAGGFHRKSNLGCTLCMIGMWGISLGLAEIVVLSGGTLLALYIGTNAVLYFFAPADFHNHCRLTEEQREKKRKLAVIIANIAFLIAVFLLDERTRLFIIIPICMETVTIIPFQQLIKRRTAQ